LRSLARATHTRAHTTVKVVGAQEEVIAPDYLRYCAGTQEMDMQLEVGNTAHMLEEAAPSRTADANRWEWQLFVRVTQGSPDAVAKVMATLHPTFKNRHVTLKLTNGPVPSFATSKIRGWGTFNIGIDVFLTGQDKPVQLDHMLSFDAAETSFVHLLPVSPTPPVAAPLTPPVVSDQRQEVVEAPSDDDVRETIEERLQNTEFLQADDPKFFHGRGFPGSTGVDTRPRVTWESAERPREDHDAPDWLTATEFVEQPNILRQKIEYLAQLLKLSRKTVIYSGAGISVAAQVAQAARGGAGAGGRSTDAQPTFTHLAAGVLAKAGLLHGWVQQNHDGLPQKAGFPQEDINEIHGSWYDPANPVVKYSGTLKEDTYPWMRHDADTADLVLVMGTSLGGLNADQMATKPAERSLSGGTLGTVIMNLQQTEQDGKSTLRLFGETDMIMRHLLRQLGLKPPTLKQMKWKKRNRVAVPYDADGHLLESKDGTAAQPKMWLDLSVGQRVRLTPGHNIQGAKQPSFMHIGAETGTVHTYKGKSRPAAEGLGTVTGRCDTTSSFDLNIEGVRMRLGIWWLEAAARGGPRKLPIVNVDPEFC